MSLTLVNKTDATLVNKNPTLVNKAELGTTAQEPTDQQSKKIETKTTKSLYGAKELTGLRFRSNVARVLFVGDGHRPTLPGSTDPSFNEFLKDLETFRIQPTSCLIEAPTHPLEGFKHRCVRSIRSSPIVDSFLRLGDCERQMRYPYLCCFPIDNRQHSPLLAASFSLYVDLWGLMTKQIQPKNNQSMRTAMWERYQTFTEETKLLSLSYETMEHVWMDSGIRQQLLQLQCTKDVFHFSELVETKLAEFSLDHELSTKKQIFDWRASRIGRVLVSGEQQQQQSLQRYIHEGMLFYARLMQLNLWIRLLSLISQGTTRILVVADQSHLSQVIQWLTETKAVISSNASKIKHMKTETTEWTRDWVSRASPESTENTLIDDKWMTEFYNNLS